MTSPVANKNEKIKKEDKKETLKIIEKKDDISSVKKHRNGETKCVSPFPQKTSIPLNKRKCITKQSHPDNKKKIQRKKLKAKHTLSSFNKKSNLQVNNSRQTHPINVDPSPSSPRVPLLPLKTLPEHNLQDFNMNGQTSQIASSSHPCVTFPASKISKVIPKIKVRQEKNKKKMKKVFPKRITQFQKDFAKSLRNSKYDIKDIAMLLLKYIKPSEILPSSPAFDKGFEVISILKHLNTITITPDLLSKTKLGKIVNQTRKSKLGAKDKKIPKLCNELIQCWKRSIVKNKELSLETTGNLFRDGIRKQIFENLSKRNEKKIQGEKIGKKITLVTNQENISQLSRMDLYILVDKIESTMYKEAGSIVCKGYRIGSRDLLYNIKDYDNTDIFDHLTQKKPGSIGIDKLCSSLISGDGHTYLASKQLKKLRREETKQAIEAACDQQTWKLQHGVQMVQTDEQKCPGCGKYNCMQTGSWILHTKIKYLYTCLECGHQWSVVNK